MSFIAFRLIVLARLKRRALPVWCRGVVKCAIDCYRSGSLRIDLFQPNGRVAALLLDPRSIGSISRYPEFAVLVVPEEKLFICRAFTGILQDQP